MGRLPQAGGRDRARRAGRRSLAHSSETFLRCDIARGCVPAPCGRVVKGGEDGGREVAGSSIRRDLAAAAPAISVRARSVARDRFRKPWLPRQGRLATACPPSPVPLVCSLQHARPVVAGEEPPGAASPVPPYEDGTEAPAASRATTSRDASPAKAASEVWGRRAKRGWNGAENRGRACKGWGSGGNSCTESAAAPLACLIAERWPEGRADDTGHPPPGCRPSSPRRGDWQADRDGAWPADQASQRLRRL
jgi:hypothetical protein